MQHELHIIRKLKGATQADFAKILGISERGYSAKERGERKFYFDEIKKISDYAGYKISEIKLVEVYGYDSKRG